MEPGDEQQWGSFIADGGYNEEDVQIAANDVGAGAGKFGWSLSSIGDLSSVAGMAASVAGDIDAAVMFTKIEDQLTQIEGQLTAIQNQLTAIQNQLTALQNELNALVIITEQNECSTLTAGMTSAYSDVMAVLTQYLVMVNDATNAQGLNPPPVPPVWGSTTDGVDQSILGWANAVIDGESLHASIPDDLISINQTLLAANTGTGQSAIAACAAADYTSSVNQSASQDWETAYYNNMYTYLTPWIVTQIVGAAMVMEAQNAMAQEAMYNAVIVDQFNQGLYVTMPQGLCNQSVINAAAGLSPASNTSAFAAQSACQNAQLVVAQTYQNVLNELAAAGVAFSTVTGGLATTQAPSIAGANGLLWTVDINNFAPSSSCPTPLTSTGTACGSTVGTTGPLSTTSQFGYNNWVPATSSNWFGTLNPNPSQSLYVLMNGNGLGSSSHGPGAGLNNLIIYTGETTSSSNSTFTDNWRTGVDSKWTPEFTGLCFMDTNFHAAQKYPFCDSTGGFGLWNLINNFGQIYNPQDYDNVFSAAINVANGDNGFFYSNPGYYNAAFPDYSGYATTNPWTVWTPPGWFTGSANYVCTDWEKSDTCSNGSWQGSGTAEYRWPVTPLNQMTCASVTNGQTAASGSSSASSPGYLTSSGAYTACGIDQQSWLAAQMGTLAPYSASGSGSGG